MYTDEKPKTIYLKVKDAEKITTVGTNPIYRCNGKYFVGLELIPRLSDSDLEHAVEFDTEDQAKRFARRLN